MRKETDMKRLLALALFVAIQVSAVLVPSMQASAAQISKKTIVLTIKGDGVSKTTKYTLPQLQTMKKGTVTSAYSAVNSLPTGKFFVGKGVTLTCLLQKSGVKPEAKYVTFYASDGYKRKIAIKRLNSTLYYYPGVMEGNADGKKTVPAILAWSHAENTNDVSKIKADQLRLMIGQASPDEADASDFVKYVNTIEVTKK